MDGPTRAPKRLGDLDKLPVEASRLGYSRRAEDPLRHLGAGVHVRPLELSRFRCRALVAFEAAVRTAQARTGPASGGVVGSNSWRQGDVLGDPPVEDEIVHAPEQPEMRDSEAQERAAPPALYRLDQG